MFIDCYCCSGLAFRDCCQSYIESRVLPGQPEQLMRSRYSAFVLCNVSYLLSTWHPLTRPYTLELEPAQKWLGLKIKRACTHEGKGYVEFVARYRVGGGRADKLCEISEFIRDGGSWLYFGQVGQWPA